MKQIVKSFVITKYLSLSLENHPDELKPNSYETWSLLLCLNPVFSYYP